MAKAPPTVRHQSGESDPACNWVAAVAIFKPADDHLLLRFFRNKVDYCRIHGHDIFYNNALLHPKMRSFWARIPVVRAAMLAHPQAEWIWRMDSNRITKESKKRDRRNTNGLRGSISSFDKISLPSLFLDGLRNGVTCIALFWLDGCSDGFVLFVCFIWVIKLSGSEKNSEQRAEQCDKIFTGLED
ncbi:hypothetical protein NE237_017049 [Protea cynaroides]|uniref:Uncharacterized protein n=1 Tax=Protea cynaroides TaxID=273540 RepID=A0A9Q0QMC2_9MAGN|nr:hypothetical protein NE237_017049 [Protea cynaroides]